MFCSREDLGQPGKVCKTDLSGVLQLREKKSKSRVLRWCQELAA